MVQIDQRVVRRLWFEVKPKARLSRWACFISLGPGAHGIDDPSTSAEASSPDRPNQCGPNLNNMAMTV
ncbi:hypothetical protein DPEC_G00308860 [Dallia pectoralis]|uniref:Uncharacterized protein n=1 Tax=Dallia pectoralis TaxID=75939 RepID=A0ACC2FET5_DALPE|nr:hypothetical protein DPEC_G00308860 [Dallia pectoralis]